MAVPKKRKSKMKTRSRRAANIRLNSPHFQACPNCGTPKRTHRVCMECGKYGEEQVVEVWEY